MHHSGKRGVEAGTSYSPGKFLLPVWHNEVMADPLSQLRGVPAGPVPLGPVPTRPAHSPGVSDLHDARPDRDHMSLSGLHADGEVIRTPAGSGRPRDLEVAFRAALRDFLRTGLSFANAEQQLLKAGTPAAEVARYKAEEASSFYRMSRDTFLKSSGAHDALSAQRESSGTRILDRRIANLRQEAMGAFQGATRSHELLGGLDPIRRRELASMEQWLLSRGFPKDELLLKQ
ncbi:MAG: hypothetical protein VKO21_08315 [Candidatus Sericytochromatia bacterium]|nr:hypothetical protein [Candidatus Sericytochromatia bacterium]